MIPAHDYPLDYLASMPVFTSSALREDRAFHMLGAAFKSGDHFIVGTRPLTDAELAGLEAAHAVRVAYAEAGIMSWLRLPVGAPPTRDNVSLMARLKAYAEKHRPTPSGLIRTMPPPPAPVAVTRLADSPDRLLEPGRLLPEPLRVESVPVVRRGVPIETRHGAAVADNIIIDQARHIFDRDAAAEGFEVISDLTISHRETRCATSGRWFMHGHWAVLAPHRDRHIVTANTIPTRGDHP